MKILRYRLIFAGLLACSACDGPSNNWSTQAETQSQGIVNGNDESGYPAVGGLVLVVPGREPTGTSCTGSLIAPRWVLTAAHCVSGLENRVPGNAAPSDTNYLNFYIGNNANDKENGRRIPASRIFIHPGYFEPGGDRPNDIALFELSEPVTDIDPLPFNRLSLDDKLDAELFYVGFGVDQPDGGGGGHKRSIAASLYNTAPNIYVTEQQGGGVCFGDSGGPGLLWIDDHYEIIGVNSTVFGEEKCLHFSTQIRTDAHQTWIDVTMGNGQGCIDSPDLCQCDGVCGADGVCDNAQCGQADCEGISNCLGFCNDYPCSVMCFLRAAPDAAYLYRDIANCTREYCPNGGRGCVEQYCRRENFACEEGMDAVTGEQQCGQLHRCSDVCAPDDINCLDTCFFEGTLDAQSQLEQVQACEAEQCGDLMLEEERDECIAKRCREDLLTCMPDETCRLSGGNCSENTACTPALWIATYCLPTQKTAIGEACDPSQVSCVDGAMCIDQGNGHVCREICAAGSDCDVSYPPCTPMHQGNLAFSIGVCSLECSDQDKDGVCDRNDCNPRNPYIYPGALEICDAEMLDENCDGIINDTCEVGSSSTAMPPAPPAMPEPEDKSFWSCACLLDSSSDQPSLLISMFLLIGLVRRRKDQTRPAMSIALLCLFMIPMACSKEAPTMPPGSNPAAMMDSGVYQPNPAASHDAGVVPSPGIWEIQQGLVESGTTHTLTEVIVTSEVTDEGFFIADGSNRPFSGLYVRLFEPLSKSVSIGDTINIQGTVDEYTSNTEHQDDTTKTLTQLKLVPNSQMTKTGTSSDALAINLGAQELSYPDSAEMYEGVLISLTDLVITATRAARGEIVVDDIIVVSDDFVDFDFTWLEPGTRFDKLTALLHFENEEYKLLPRALNDIQRSDVATGNCVPVDGYLICMEEKKNWENARKACASLGGRLVILETKEESDRVSNMVREWTDQTYWMALSDRWTEGRWAWTTGSTLAYNSAWANNEPNDWGGGEDCAEGNFRGPRQWNDAKCNGSKNFVCEFPGDGPQCVEDDDCNVENATCQNGSCTPA